MHPLPRWQAVAAPPREDPMRLGRNVQVRPLGGRVGCFAMIAFSILASVILTVVLNLLLR